MNESLLDSVKRHEGFRDQVYLDSLGKRTVGYGHLCVEDHWEDGKVYDKEYLEEILKKDLQHAVDTAAYMCEKTEANEEAQNIITEMVFQLGGNGVSKFKMMWEALKCSPPNYTEASVQMLDSKWASQVGNRAIELSEIIRTGKYVTS